MASGWCATKFKEQDGLGLIGGSVAEMSPALLEYLTALAEGRPGIPNWHDWRREHDQELQECLTRTEYLRIKFYPLAETRAMLRKLDVQHGASDEYAWLDGLPDRCRYCGAETVSTGGGGSYCPQGCYRLMV